MKVAKLVYVNLLVRVLVDKEADDQEIMELAVPKLSEQLMDSPFEHIDKIVYDNECPYVMGEEFALTIGDEVNVPSPNQDEVHNNEFTGEIVNIKQDSDGTLYASIVDMDGDFFDVNLDRLTKIW